MTKISNRHLFFFSIPLICSLLTQQLYGAVDMIIVGQTLGANELAAVGNASNLVMLFIVISGGFELSIEIIFSRFLGKNQLEKLAQSTVNVLVLGTIAGIILAGIGLISMPVLFRLMNIPAHLIGYTQTYCSIYFLGVPFIYLYDISRAMITTLGDSKKSFALILASSLLNIVLNLFFILELNLGVAGAALGTVFSQGILMLVSLWLLYLKSKQNPYFIKKFHLDLSQLKELGHIALPTIFQQFVITLASVFLQALVNPFGKEIIIGYVAITKVLAVTRIVVSGFSQTLSIYSARLLAGEQYADVNKVYRFLVMISLIYTLGIVVVFFLFPKFLCNLFFDPNTHEAGYHFFKTYLYCSSISMFMTVFKFMNENLLRSALQMKNYLFCNVGDLLVRIGSIFLLLQLLSENVFWIGELLGRLFALVFSFYFLYQLKQKMKVLPTASEINEKKPNF